MLAALQVVGSRQPDALQKGLGSESGFVRCDSSPNPNPNPRF
jgi:hypothetical protein